MSRLRDAMKWLGIKDVRPLEDRVYDRMVRIAKKHHRPVSTSDLNELCDGGKLQRTLFKLRRAGRVENVAKGKWIPLP